MLMDMPDCFPHPLILKNTFLEFPEKPTGLVRAQTAPVLDRSLEYASTQGSLSPRSDHSEGTSSGDEGLHEICSSPCSTTRSPSPSLPLQARPQFEEKLHVKNTFLEYYIPQQEELARSQSAPEILGLDVRSSSMEDALPCAALWPATPTPHSELLACQMLGGAALWPATPTPHSELLACQMAVPSSYATWVPAIMVDPFCLSMEGAPCSAPECTSIQMSRELTTQREHSRHHQCAAVKDGVANGRASHGQPEGVQLPADEQRAKQLIAGAQTAKSRKCGGSVWDFACKDKASSLIVQKAVEISAQDLWNAASEEAWAIAADAAEALMSDFRWRVREAIIHPHANYVIHKIVELMPPMLAAFVPEALLGRGTAMSKHRVGCRTVLRIFRHQLAAAQGKIESANALAEEVLGNAATLLNEEFGNYVIQEFLESGTADIQRRIVGALRFSSDGSSGALLCNAQKKHGSRIVEAALWFCDPEDAQAIADELLASVNNARTLAMSDFGGHVLKTIVRSGRHSGRAFGHLQKAASDLKASKQRSGRWLADFLHKSAATSGGYS